MAKPNSEAWSPVESTHSKLELHTPASPLLQGARRARPARPAPENLERHAE